MVAVPGTTDTSRQHKVFVGNVSDPVKEMLNGQKLAIFKGFNSSVRHWGMASVDITAVGLCPAHGTSELYREQKAGRFYQRKQTISSVL